VEPVITVVAIAGLAVTFLALAVALGTPPSLRRYADRSDRWDEFERGFARHVSTGRREQNPLRRAVTRTPRSTPQCSPSGTEVPR
jgi:hypothetical protein